MRLAGSRAPRRGCSAVRERVLRRVARARRCRRRQAGTSTLGTISWHRTDGVTPHPNRATACAGAAECTPRRRPLGRVSREKAWLRDCREAGSETPERVPGRLSVPSGRRRPHVHAQVGRPGGRLHVAHQEPHEQLHLRVARRVAVRGPQVARLDLLADERGRTRGWAACCSRTP